MPGEVGANRKNLFESGGWCYQDANLAAFFAFKFGNLKEICFFEGTLAPSELMLTLLATLYIDTFGGPN